MLKISYYIKRAFSILRSYVYYVHDLTLLYFFFLFFLQSEFTVPSAFE